MFNPDNTKKTIALNRHETWNNEISAELTGRQLKAYRKHYNLTQEKLSDIICTKCVQTASKNAVSAWENGKRNLSLHHAAFLAKLYGCKISDLVLRYRDKVKEPQAGIVRELDSCDVEIDPVRTGKKLRQFRASFNLTQAKLSEIFGEDSVHTASANAISEWERGHKLPSLQHMVDLSCLYGCLIDDLVVFYGDPDKEHQGQGQVVPVNFKNPKDEHVQTAHVRLFLLTGSGTTQGWKTAAS